MQPREPTHEFTHGMCPGDLHFHLQRYKNKSNYIYNKVEKFKKEI